MTAVPRPRADDPLPSLAVTVPVHDERPYLERLVAGIREQDYAGIREVWFVDDASTDGSGKLLRLLCADDDRLHVVPSDGRGQAAAVNTGFARSTTDLVLRLDAHAVYAPDMVSRQVDALLRTGAAAVGVVARPLVDGEESGPGSHAGRAVRVAQAIGAVHRSRLGIGAASFRRDDASGWVDTVWNGCYWRQVVEAVGPLREDLPRTEDNEFHARLRRHGHRLYLTSEARAWYRPRTTLGDLGRQYWSTGSGVARALRTTPGALGLRHLVPAVFVTTLLAAGVAAVGSSWGRWSLAGLGAAYGLVLLGGTVGALRARRGGYLLFVAPALVVLHFSYGIGTLVGLVQRTRPERVAVASPAGPSRRVARQLRALDLLLCLAAAPLVVPVVAVLAVLVKLDSAGPAFHHGQRAGRHGRPYRIHKLRSMVVDAHLGGAGVTTNGDPRVTRMGRWLRRTKLDELPQLWNVVVGDMSLVGPRPEDPRYVEHYSADQRVVLSVRPGLTSPASLLYRDEERLLDGPDWERFYVDVLLPHKLEIDARYVATCSLRTYLTVLVRTASGITPSIRNPTPTGHPAAERLRVPSGPVLSERPEEIS